MPDKVKLPSIKELTSGLSTGQQNVGTTSTSTPGSTTQLTSSPPLQPGSYQPTAPQQQIRHASIGSSTGASPQQIYYQHHQSTSQPSILLPTSTIPSTNSSISSNSSILDGADQLLGAGGVASRKSSTSITPPYQAVPFPPQNNGNYIITNPQFDMLNYKIQQTHPINPFEQLQQQHQQQPQPYHNSHYNQPIHLQQPSHHQHYNQHIHQTTQPKKKRPRRKANEMERLYACNYKNCKNSYGTLNHLNAHITFKRHGPKRKPEEFKQIRELYKSKKNKLDELAKKEKNSEGTGGIKLLANLSESLLDNVETNNIDLVNGIRESNNNLVKNSDITELPIYHQQRGYNGYGRHSYTLKQGSD